MCSYCALNTPGSLGYPSPHEPLGPGERAMVISGEKTELSVRL